MSVNSQYASALRELKTKQAHLLEEVGDQWRTPEDLFWGINAVFGPFDMDLFTDGDNAHCARYYTAEDNALVQDWTADLNGGKGFANPPYSRPCKDEEGNDMTGMITIMNKAKAERDKGAKLAFLIRGVPSETWWPEQADHICFIKGRVGFKLPDWFIPANDKQKASSAAFAGAVVIFDKEWRGVPISYIHRDSLRAQGKKLLDMIEAAAEKKAATYITGTIETRPDTAEQGEPQVSAQIDIDEQIAREPVVHVVSFSGGRTSAYLVHIMEQKRKSENLDVRYVFMDTGAEHPKTYEFIRNVVNHYGIDLVCLRTKVDPKKGVGISYQIINLDDCKHDLQPWKDVLSKYGTPYIHGAFCTRSMKTDPIEKFIAAELNNIKVHQWLGIRVDEPKRLREKDGFSYLATISDFEKEDVLNFWQEMPFNLDIPEWLGNCVFCIKKGVNKIALAAKQEPELAQDFMSALESNDVKNVERKHGKLIMYRGHNSLTSIIETHINHTEQDLIQAMRGKTDSGSCSESCEAFACDENQDLPSVNAIWPIEVLNIAKEVLRLHGTTVAEITEVRLKEICEEINRQRLEGQSPDSIIDDLFMNMPTETKSCAA